VLLKIVCLLMRWLFGLAILVIRGDRAKNAELLALRHENAVRRRKALLRGSIADGCRLVQ